MLVGNVIKDSPADEAGMLEGDVILAIDDIVITDGTSLIRFLGSKKIGDKIKIKVWRKRSETALRVTIKERP